MHAILISMGSLGDTLPFVYLGQALRARGHAVTLLANEHYQSLIEARGLGFATILTDERYRNFIENRRTSAEIDSLVDMAKLVVEQVEPVYRLIADKYVPGETVVAAQGYALGARIAEETLGVPLATVHVQPLWLRSSYDMPPIPSWFPLFIKRGLQAVMDGVLDKAIGADVMKFRASFGLKPRKRAMRDWWNSPRCVLGLFPDWYSAPQPDWPANTHLVGFPLPDETDPGYDMTPVDAFLDAGSAPLVFSQSSIASDTKAFFETSIELAQKLERRALFLTSMTDLLPAELPPGMKHFPFVPLDKLLLRCACHIHHGGIGTIALTIQAGIPQITVAKIYDQPDNSARLARLGISKNIAPKKYTVRKTLGPMRELLHSPDVARHCEDYAQRMRSADPLGQACEILEGLVAAPTPAATSID